MIEVVNVAEAVGVSMGNVHNIRVESFPDEPKNLVCRGLRKFSCLYDVFKDYMNTIIYVRKGVLEQKIELLNGEVITIKATNGNNVARSLPWKFITLNDITHLELHTDASFDDVLINQYRNTIRSSMFQNVYDFVPVKFIDRLINKYGFKKII